MNFFSKRDWAVSCEYCNLICSGSGDENRSVNVRDTQTLISEFNIRVFLLLLEESLNFLQQGKTSITSLNVHAMFDLPCHQYSDCMNSSSKVHFMLFFYFH